MRHDAVVIGGSFAGFAARASRSAIWAAADGATAGVSLHQALVFNARDT